LADAAQPRLPCRNDEPRRSLLPATLLLRSWRRLVLHALRHLLPRRLLLHSLLQLLPRRLLLHSLLQLLPRRLLRRLAS